MFTGFKALNIQGKLLIVFGLIIFIGVLITGWTIIAVSAMDRIGRELLETDQELSDLLQAENDLTVMELSLLSYILSGNERYLNAHGGPDTSLETYLRRALLRNDNPNVTARLAAFEREKQTYDSYVLQVVEAVTVGDEDQTFAAERHLTETINSMLDQIDLLVEIFLPEVNDKLHRSEVQVSLSTVAGSIALVAFVGLAIVVGGVANRLIIQPLLYLTQAAQAIEQGTYTTDILRALDEREDEIGELARSFMTMAQELDDREKALMDRVSHLKTELESMET
jgi:HAMP domain-containing protein